MESNMERELILARMERRRLESGLMEENLSGKINSNKKKKNDY